MGAVIQELYSRYSMWAALREGLEGTAMRAADVRRIGNLGLGKRIKITA